MDETTKQNLKVDFPLGPSKSKNCATTAIDSKFFSKGPADSLLSDSPSKQEFDCEIFLSNLDLKTHKKSFKHLSRTISTVMEKIDVKCSQIDEVILLSNVLMDFDPDAAIILQENDSKIDNEQADSLSSTNQFKINISYNDFYSSQQQNEAEIPEISFENIDCVRGQGYVGSEIEDLIR
jgi:hypothetical protein